MKSNDLTELREGRKTIAVVADSSIRAQQMVDAMHLLKIPNIRSFKNFFELSVAVDKQNIHWIYGTYYDQDGEVLATYLPQMTEHPGLLVSAVVLLKESEKQHIPMLFNCGLLHWVEAENTPDGIAQGLYKFLKNMQTGPEPALQAFATLRSYWKGEECWKEIATTAEKLLQLYPEADLLRLNQIEALDKVGESGRARGLLLDLDLYDSKLAPYVAQLRESLLDQNETHHKLLAVQFNMRTALIVDPLPESLALIESKCKELGFRDVHVFKDGADAAELIKKQKIDFAVIEWQCPSLSGPFLIQRLREECAGDMPIIVISDNLDRSDIQLVKDMGVAQVLRRPLNAQQLTIAAAWAISQAKAPTEAHSIERKLLATLSEGDLHSAEQLLRKFQTIASRDPLKDIYLKACLAYHRGRYLDAKKLLLEATHRSKGDNVHLAAMLAKCLIRLGDVKAALLLLKRITSFSPKNLERLCALASVALENNDLHLAEESLISAEALDPEATQVQMTKAVVAVAGGHTQAAGDAIKMLADVEGVVTYLNNLAVSFARSMELTEALRIYKNCLKVIPGDRISLRAIVTYNLGLGLVKNKEPQLASVYLKQAITLGQSPVYARASSLYERIIEARRLGVDPQLRLAENHDAQAVQEQTIEPIPLFANIEELRQHSRLLKGMVMPLQLTRRAS